MGGGGRKDLSIDLRMYNSLGSNRRCRGNAGVPTILSETSQSGAVSPVEGVR